MSNKKTKTAFEGVLIAVAVTVALLSVITMAVNDDTAETSGAVGKTFTKDKIVYEITTEDTFTNVYEAVIKGYETGLKTATIGKKVNDYDIVGMKEGAFRYCKELVEIDLKGASFNNISKVAFDGCTSLKTVTLHPDITEIPVGAFGDCTALETLTNVGSLKTIGDMAFVGCGKLSSFDFKTMASLEIIGDCAFSGTGLKSVSFGPALTKIGTIAFMSCESITDIRIPATVTSIGFCAFHNSFKSGESLTVDDGNSNYSSESNMLFDKEKTRLILGRNAASVTVPATVNALEEGAFYGFSSVKVITFLGSAEPTFGYYSMAMGDVTFTLRAPFDKPELDVAVLKDNTSGEITKYNYEKISTVPDPAPGSGYLSTLAIAAVAIVGLGAAGAAIWFFRFRRP